MRTKRYTMLTSILFGCIALLHLSRILWQWDAMVNGVDVPLWVNWLSVLVAGTLSYQGYTLTQKSR